MVDTLVEGLVHALTDVNEGLWGPYWSDESTGIIVFFDNGGDISFARTTDKGVNWATTKIEAGAVMVLSCWYDKETPGNAGTLIHMVWIDATDSDGSRDLFYQTLDVSDGGLGTKRTVDGAITVGFVGENRLAITQTVSSNIIVAFSTQTQIECYKSDDNFATAGTDIADVFELGTEEDHCLLFPAAMADDNDACALFWDRSANELSIKMWDDSVGTWTETSISGAMTDDFEHINMDGAVRHSDSHLLVAAHSNDDNAGDDLRTWDLTVDSIASPTVTAKTNIFTDQGESAQVAVFINQQNDDVYIAHLKGGTWTVTVDVVFHISTDGMGSWGSEQAYSESAADDFRLVRAGRTVGDAGGRYQPTFYDDDQVDIYINETNDIEIAAAGGTTHQGQAVLSGVGAVAAVAGLTLPAIVAVSGVGTLVAAGTIGETRLGAVVLSGVGSLSAVAVMTLTGEVQMAGTGDLVVAGERGVSGAVALAGVGSLVVIGEVGLEGRAALAGVGSMSVLAQRIVPGIVALSGVGSLDVTGSPTLVGAATLSGVGTMTVLADSGVFIYTVFGEIRRLIDPADYPVGVDLLFEVQFSSPVGSETKARLFNITDAIAVSGSELSTTSLTTVRLRTSALSLAAGAKEYRVEFAGQSGDIYNVVSADVIPVSS